jgi:hypothetical protein
VLYHNIILNRILRACLLSDKPGHQVTFKILMALLSLILDLAKTVAEVERGTVTAENGAAHVSSIRNDWSDKKAVFVSVGLGSIAGRLVFDTTHPAVRSGRMKGLVGRHAY